MKLIYKLVQNMLIYFVIAIGENSYKMKNNAIMLSSVYDAMKNNVEDSYRNKVYRDDAYDLRSKRNINEKWDVANNVNYEDSSPHVIKPEGWANDLISSGSELICSVYKNGDNSEQSQRIFYPAPVDSPFGTNLFSSVGSLLAKSVKYILAGIALISLPLLFLAAFLLPLKVLLGIKTMAMANSFVLGTLIWRLLNRVVNNNTDSTTTTQASNDLPMEDVGHQVTADYHEYNEDDLQRILKSIKHKNKDW